MIRNIVLILLAVALAGCTSLFGADSVFRDRRSDYLKAEEMQPIQVPEDLDSETLGVAFPVPPAGQVSDYQLATEFETPRPDELSTDQVGQVRIQRLDEDQWILVPAPPAEAWPRIRGYLTENRIPTLRTDADNGIIETGLLNYGDDDGTLHQFLLKLEQGVQLNTTEIVVRHRQFPSGAVPEVMPDWTQDQTGDSEEAEEMRLQIAESLAADEGSGTASLLGQRIGAAAKVEIITPSAVDPYILMHLSYARSWASVEFALGTATFSIESSDRDAGVFNLLLLSGTEQDYSWLRRVLRGSNGNLGQPYQLNLRQVDDSVEVRVMSPEGDSLPQREAFEFLTLLRSKLA